jgi:hypothetical protein
MRRTRSRPATTAECFRGAIWNIIGKADHTFCYRCGSILNHCLLIKVKPSPAAQKKREEREAAIIAL